MLAAVILNSPVLQVVHWHNNAPADDGRLTAVARGNHECTQMTRATLFIAREIMALRGDRALALPFAAVADNPSLPNRAGPNLVQNPSFEEPARADGSPPGQYLLGYPEPKDQPRGALTVSDEATHSGRFSLKWDLSKVAETGPVRRDPRWLVVNVPFSGDPARGVRGKRVKLGYWVRMGGGTTVPGLQLRQNLSGGPGEGFRYDGGLEDPAAWNHFETEGRLSETLESMDIHTWVAVPEAELARKSSFYMDDFTLQVVEDPPLSVTTALDEYFLGEAVPWIVQGNQETEPVTVALRKSNRKIAQQAGRIVNRRWQGEFQTRGLQPGLYQIEVTLDRSSASPLVARWQFLLTPDPFAWPRRRP